jgi:hypothetical protein
MTSGCGQDAMREQCRLVALGPVLRTFGAPGVFGVAGRRILHPLRGAPRGYRTLSASHRDWLPCAYESQR